MTVATLYPSEYRASIGLVTDVAPELSAGFLTGQGDYASGVLFELPEDFPTVTVTEATLRYTSVATSTGLTSIFRSRLGIAGDATPFAAQDFHLAALGAERIYFGNEDYLAQVPDAQVDETILYDQLYQTEIDITSLVAEALADGWLDARHLQVIFQVEDYAPGLGPPLRDGVHTLDNLSIKITYTTPPLRVTMPDVVYVGRTRQASVRRGDVTPSPLTVDLTTSPSGRLILPASVTIPASHAHATFAVQGQAEGLVTVTATADLDEDEAETEVLPAPSAGLGDELGWWCPSRDSAGDGTTTLTDLSGNGNHGTITGSVAWETNAGARCLSLTGGYVDIGHHAIFDFDRTDPFTLAAWLLVPAGSSAGIPVISKLMGSSPFRGYEIRLNNPSASVAHLLNTYNTNDLTRQVAHSVFDPRGAWRHWAVTYDGSGTGGGVNIYWNGVLRTATTPNSNLSATIKNTVPLQLGARHGSGSTFRLDDARIYGRALSAGEVAVLAKSRGVLGDGTLARLAGPLRSRLTNHRINAGRISR